ncbi:transporter substrate-binding domain-containing protein [Pseudomonas gingeri]|uniref:Transporter substrate-binding domain-containing protein n=2 Tax=Pseudomonas gingeri TaxID=117681 RepID=A0A7Y7YFS2_9PSED|nr:transporter substrate-binding domain-containing protein [Pseudomonas gingeri]NWA12115.1 transporter substrate-binding domain-containing protein [Pseudomonas gingeri]NWA57478.1 transporter substrate-binding domain-containing protein [Pseudomonas gingeri]NWA93821.1 transporter substrate-binding domain-containing protein [Pseudomonas gingeri]NWB03293.1 transporter substrate-binding domain-containing protein [Pseudomonas gingeri]
MFSSTFAQAGDALSHILESKELRVAVPVDYPPYGYVGPDMVPQGLDIDVANLMANKLGVKLELVPVTAPNRVAYIQSGKADFTISSLGKTPEREKVIDYSIAYSPFFDAVFGAAALPVKSLADMTGKSVSVTRGSMQDRELTDTAPQAVAKRFEDNNSTISAFMSGQTQMVAIGTTVAASLKQKNPDLDIALKVVLSNSPNYIGMNKDQPELRAKVNEIIRAAKADGTLDAISQKWLGAPAGELPE